MYKLAYNDMYVIMNLRPIVHLRFKFNTCFRMTMPVWNPPIFVKMPKSSLSGSLVQSWILSIWMTLKHCKTCTVGFRRNDNCSDTHVLVVCGQRRHSTKIYWRILKIPTRGRNGYWMYCCHYNHGQEKLLLAFSSFRLSMSVAFRQLTRLEIVMQRLL